MMQYMPEDVLMNRMKRSAELYYNIINVNFNNENINRIKLMFNYIVR